MVQNQVIYFESEILKRIYDLYTELIYVQNGYKQDYLIYQIMGIVLKNFEKKVQIFQDGKN